MKYLITESQLKTLRKYMKSFINENVVKGYDALNQFPFSELPETYQDYANNGFSFNIQGWGSKVDIPSGGDSLRSIKSKEELTKFIDMFESEYGEEPMFEINPNANWYSKIQITNPSFQKDSQRYIAGKSKELEKDRQRGFSIDEASFGKKLGMAALGTGLSLLSPKTKAQDYVNPKFQTSIVSNKDEIVIKNGRKLEYVLSKIHNWYGVDDEKLAVQPTLDSIKTAIKKHLDINAVISEQAFREFIERIKSGKSKYRVGKFNGTEILYWKEDY